MVIENVLPSVNTKAHFSRGLQSASPLVQHYTALAIAKCLTKYKTVLTFFSKVQAVLEEDEDGGQWSRRRQEIEREVRRRVPDLQVIVAFSQQRSGDSAATQNAIQAALLAESSTRLLWLYHQCLPSLVAEARFGVGKLLLYISDTVLPERDSLDSIAGLATLRQLHVLRLLQESEQFAWSGKTGEQI